MPNPNSCRCAKRLSRVSAGVCLLVVGPSLFGVVANAADLYDTSDYRLAGAEPGMTPEEAREVVGALPYLGDADLKQLFTDEEHPHTGETGSEVSAIYRVDNGLSVGMRFYPMKDNERPMQLGSIEIRQPNDEDQRESLMKAISEQLIEKYGPPTFDDLGIGKGWRYRWCSEVNEEKDDCAYFTQLLEADNESVKIQYGNIKWW